jgi:hypothetical protein
MYVKSIFGSRRTQKLRYFGRLVHVSMFRTAALPLFRALKLPGSQELQKHYKSESAEFRSHCQQLRCINSPASGVDDTGHAADYRGANPSRYYLGEVDPTRTTPAGSDFSHVDPYMLHLPPSSQGRIRSIFVDVSHLGHSFIRAARQQPQEDARPSSLIDQ